MEFSELTIRLLLLFFPGLIASLIVDSLTTHREKDFKVFLLNSFLYGVSSYFLLYVIIGFNNWIVRLRGQKTSWKVHFLESLINGKSTISFKEVIIVTLFSVILGFIVVMFTNFRLLHKFSILFKISKKFGQLDVWAYVFESPDIKYVIVRDIENDLMYQGWIEAFSDTSDKSELFLRDVIVYRNSTAEELYTMGGVYLTKNRDNITLEFQI